MTMRTVHDPFMGKDVQISDRLVDRLRGKYASGPHLPNGKPEFGWRQFQAPPIQHDAAARIEELEAALLQIDAINDNPARFSMAINDVILAALPDHIGNRKPISARQRDEGAKP